MGLAFSYSAWACWPGATFHHRGSYVAQFLYAVRSFAARSLHHAASVRYPVRRHIFQTICFIKVFAPVKPHPPQILLFSAPRCPMLSSVIPAALPGGRGRFFNPCILRDFNQEVPYAAIFFPDSLPAGYARFYPDVPTEIYLALGGAQVLEKVGRTISSAATMPCKSMFAQSMALP